MPLAIKKLIWIWKTIKHYWNVNPLYILKWNWYVCIFLMPYALTKSNNDDREPEEHDWGQVLQSFNNIN